LATTAGNVANVKHYLAILYNALMHWIFINYYRAIILYTGQYYHPSHYARALYKNG